MSDEDEGPFLRIMKANNVQVVELPSKPRELDGGVKVVTDSHIDKALQAASALAASGDERTKAVIAQLNHAWCAEVRSLHEQLARALGYEIDQGEELPAWGELLQVAEADHALAFHTRLVHELAREQTEEF